MQKVEELLKDTELEIRLTEGKAYAAQEPLAQGSIRPLQHFSPDTFDLEPLSPDDEYYNTKKEYFNITMFSSRVQPSVIRAVVGLKKDYETRTENIDLKLLKGVYFPIDAFYNCDPLP